MILSYHVTKVKLRTFYGAVRYTATEQTQKARPLLLREGQVELGMCW
jgi:hypothetical protein